MGRWKLDWNRVVIIPVKAVSNSNNEIVEISNSLGMESAMLKGGTNPENKLKNANLLHYILRLFYLTNKEQAETTAI